MKTKNGYTLAEVLIVVVIISILAGLSIPRFFGQREKAYAAEAFNMIGAIHHAEQIYFDANGSFLNIGNPAKDQGSCDPLETEFGERYVFQSKLGLKLKACDDETYWEYYISGSSNVIFIHAVLRTDRNSSIILKVDNSNPMSEVITWGGSGDYEPGVGKHSLMN